MLKRKAEQTLIRSQPFQVPSRHPWDLVVMDEFQCISQLKGMCYTP